MAGLLYLMAGRSPRGKVETCKVFQKLDLRLTSYGFNLYTIDRKRKRKKKAKYQIKEWDSLSLHDRTQHECGCREGRVPEGEGPVIQSAIVPYLDSGGSSLILLKICQGNAWEYSLDLWDFSFFYLTMTQCHVLQQLFLNIPVYQ